VGGIFLCGAAGDRAGLGTRIRLDQRTGDGCFGRGTAGAQVELEPKAAPAVSNQQGEFTILNLAPGNYKVTVRTLGLRLRTRMRR